MTQRFFPDNGDKFIIGVNNTVGKFINSVNDTINKFISGVNHTLGKFIESMVPEMKK